MGLQLAQALAGGGLAGLPAPLVLAQRLLQALLPHQGAGSLAFRLSRGAGDRFKGSGRGQGGVLETWGRWRRGEKGEAGEGTAVEEKEAEEGQGWKAPVQGTLSPHRASSAVTPLPSPPPPHPCPRPEAPRLAPTQPTLWPWLPPVWAGLPASLPWLLSGAGGSQGPEAACAAETGGVGGSGDSFLPLSR